MFYKSKFAPPVTDCGDLSCKHDTAPVGFLLPQSTVCRSIKETSPVYLHLRKTQKSMIPALMVYLLFVLIQNSSICIFGEENKKIPNRAKCESIYTVHYFPIYYVHLDKTVVNTTAVQ